MANVSAEQRMHLVLCGEERGVHELFVASDLLNIAYMNFSSETRLFLFDNMS